MAQYITGRNAASSRAAPFGTTRHDASVLWHAGVDLTRPPQNPAADAPHSAEPRVLQITHGEGAPCSALAVHGDGRLTIDIGQRAAEPVERDEPGAVNAADLPFVRFPDIDELNGLARRATDGQLTRFDLRNRVQSSACPADVRAELLVVRELAKLARAARGAGRVSAHLHGAELRVERVHEQEAARQRRPDAKDQLDRFRRLQRADKTGQHAKHAALRATWHESWRRRLGVDTAVAWAVLGSEHRRLSVEAEDAPIDVRLAEQHARVVDEISGSEVVGAVDDDVVVADDGERVRRREAGRV